MVDAVVVELGQGGLARRRAVVDHIRASGRVDAAALMRAEQVAGRTGQPVEQVLNQLGNLSDDDLVDLYSEATGAQAWDPVRQPITLDLAGLSLTETFLRRSRLAPLCADGETLVLAACDPLDEEAASGLTFATGRPVRLLAARPSQWQRAFDAAFGAAAGEIVGTDERRLRREIDLVADAAADGAGARVVAAAFEAAVGLGASDIHFEPRRNDLLIRLRVDGRLIEHRALPADLAAPAVSRVKVIANLDLGEKRLPQDGRTTFVVGGRQVDVRVATVPTVFGEGAVLRILDRLSVPLDLGALGMTPTVASILREAAKAPNGLFLMTGPTGSGKTTTLYALLQTFTGSEKKVLSVEDPVEYHFDHVSQTQVAAGLGLTFATALRAFLRLDPNVILVGEIRDPETAAVAAQAAMTGHLVLASIHANHALAVIPRLRDLGLQPYQLAAALRGAAAQRLVRRLCPICRRRASPTEAEVLFCEQAGAGRPESLWAPVGCEVCNGLGYKGRLAISEAFLTDEPLLRAVAEDAALADLMALASARGLRSMALDGLDKALAGLTTLAEVMAEAHA